MILFFFFMKKAQVGQRKIHIPDEVKIIADKR